jgi:hypothetical protein
MNRTDWTKWSAIAEIASSIAIVVTLIYLAIQTQQNAGAILASSRNAMIASEIALNQQVVENSSIRLARYKTGHTPEELIQLETWLIELVRTREHQWLQYQDSLLDENIWEAYLNALPVVLSFPIERAWWDFVKHDYFDHEFVAEVDRLLSDIPINDDARPTIQKALEAAGLSAESLQ